MIFFLSSFFVSVLCVSFRENPWYNSIFSISSKNILVVSCCKIQNCIICWFFIVCWFSVDFTSNTPPHQLNRARSPKLAQFHRLRCCCAGFFISPGSGSFILPSLAARAVAGSSFCCCCDGSCCLSGFLSVGCVVSSTLSHAPGGGYISPDIKWVVA